MKQDQDHYAAIAAHEAAIISNRGALAEVGKGNHAEGLSGIMARRSARDAKGFTYVTHNLDAMNWAGCANGAALNSRYAYAIENHQRAIAAHQAGIDLYRNCWEDGSAPSFQEDGK